MSNTASQALAKAIAFGGYFNGKIFDGEINPDTIHFDSLFSYYGCKCQRTVFDGSSLLIGFVTYDDGRDMPDQFFGEEDEAQKYIERNDKKMSIREVFLLRETFENERKSVPALVEIFEKYGTVLRFEDKVFDLKTVADVTYFANKFFFSLNVKIAEIVLSALASKNDRAIDAGNEFYVQKAIENLNWPTYDLRDDSTRSNDRVKDHHLCKSLIAYVPDGSSQTTDAQHIATHFGLERIIGNVNTMKIGTLRKAMLEKPTLVIVNGDRNNTGYLGLNGLLAAVASLDFVTQKMAQNCANDAQAAVDAVLKLETA